MLSFLCSLLLALWAVCVESTMPEGPCFEFPGNSFVHFTPNSFNNRDRIHYRFEFKTNQENTLLMYSHGPDGDNEAVFIRDGVLTYHLFNTATSGIEGQFGGHFTIPLPDDSDDWVTVHVYRIWRMNDDRRQREYNQTGIEATIDGQTYSDMDHWNRQDINLSPTIYFGGYKDTISSTIGSYRGKIRNLSEEKNNVVFETPSLNYESKVSTPCT